jgi:Xaa-Pro aminopeptidase
VNPPFDSQRLDELLGERGIDWVVACSKHNTRYLLGGHTCHFFEAFQAVGLSRYLPVVAYRRRHPDDAFFVGARDDVQQSEARGPLWLDVRAVRPTIPLAIDATVTELRRRGLGAGRVAVELGFMPAEGLSLLRAALPDVEWLDAVELLEELRAVKTEAELATIRAVSDTVVDTMLATFRSAAPGETTRGIRDRYRARLVERGLNFEYALIAVGSSINRTPSDRVWEDGEILSLDSGAELDGYIGDLCRMAILGVPNPALVEALAEIDAVQQAARGAIRAGAPGAAIADAALGARDRCPHREQMTFVAHGMGLVSHEIPHLTATGGVPYATTDAGRPLRAGMVLSIETHIADPGGLGFVKLEDTVIVTGEGADGVGDAGRGWNVAGEDRGVGVAPRPLHAGARS